MQILAGTSRVRPAASDYERLLDEALRYHRWAEKGWTSEQVDNERAVLLDAYDVIDGALAEAREKLAREQAARDRATRHLR